jgi:hypothetical protein
MRLRTLESCAEISNRGRLGQPPKTPGNSSVPPSVGFKANRAERRARKRRRGHDGISRRRQPPDAIMRCRPTTCAGGGEPLPEYGQRRCLSHLHLAPDRSSQVRREPLPCPPIRRRTVTTSRRWRAYVSRYGCPNNPYAAVPAQARLFFTATTPCPFAACADGVVLAALLSQHGGPILIGPIRRPLCNST